MVDAWAGGFDAGGFWWARWARLAVHPPGALVVEVPAVYRWCPLHTWAHTWTPPRLGCFNGPVGLAAWARVLAGWVLAVPDVVVCIVHTQDWYPANGRVETLEVK